MSFQKIKEKIFSPPTVKAASLFLIYFLSIIFILPDHISWDKQAIFLVYSFFIFCMIYSVIKKEKSREISLTKNIQKYNKFFVYLLIFSIFFLFITRLLPFIRFGEAPLGYDTGFYLERLKSNIFNLPDGAAFYLSLLSVYHFLGLTPFLTLNFVYILSQFMIMGSLYLLFRSMKIASNFALASIAVFLFSVSVTQFQAYWWMFAQQMLATSFLFITVALFFRSPILAILTGSIGILFHFPTFIVLGPTFFIFFIIHIGRALFSKTPINRKLLCFFIIGAVIFLIAVWIQLPAFLSNVRRIIEYRGLATNFPSWEIPKMKGLFISVLAFRLQSLFLAPFILLGFLYPSIWTKVSATRQSMFDFLIFLYIMFVGLFFLVYFPVIYQHRFIIIFDFLFIIFATPALFYFINYFLGYRGARILLGIFFLVFIIRIGSVVWAQEPQLFPDELQEIKSLAVTVEPDACVLALQSLYTPWVKGFSEHRAIGPGLPPDAWDIPVWMNFWTGGDDQERLKLLDKTYYYCPLYIFIGRREIQSQPYQKFIRTDPHFTQISSQIWKYNPNL